MNEQQQQEEIKHFQFSSQYPASDITIKNYSLQADMLTGWRPKSKIIGPIPFNFDNMIIDQLVDQLTSFGNKYKQRVIYLGPRYQNSFKLHQDMKHEYKYKYQAILSGLFNNMGAYFRKFHANFKSKRSITRIFNGMNPTLKSNDQLIFDSNFQSGNLDTSIKVGQNQYDLFMRIDSNTRGHAQWYNFTIKNTGKKKVRLNIVNFTKNRSLYNRQMKPYIYSQHLKQTKEIGWHQGGDNVKYQKKKLRYQVLNQIFIQDVITFNCLKFDYVFDTDWEIVHFCYCPPFTYSQMINMVNSFKKDMMQQIQNPQQYYIKQQQMCESLGGLNIPLLTITDPQIDDKQKKLILVSGRIHPGQSCGSYVLKGFLQYICSNVDKSQQLRKQVILKIIPMLNPDGVVIGNFRTSFCGRDLNRQFRTSSDFLIPQVRGLKQLVINLKNQFKNRFIFFLDFHGHSIKKNVFLYGSQYDIWENNYYKTRIFPKLIANRTEMFRYYSCLFRIADFKKTTARAVIFNNVPHCYTIEASTGFYYSQQDKKDIPFTPVSWCLMGKIIGEGIKDYMDLMYDQQMAKQERKQRLNQLKANKLKRKQKVQKSQSRTGNFQLRVVSVNSPQRRTRQKIDQNPFQHLSKKVRDMIQELKLQQSKLKQKKNEQGHESDQFSQGRSDSEDKSDDIPQQQLNIFHQQIIKSIKQFRMNFFNKNDHQYLFVQHKIHQQKQFKDSIKLRPARQSKGIQMIASLRKKAQQIKKIEQKSIYWPKTKQQIKLFTATMSRDSVIARSQNKMKLNFKTSLDNIEKDRKYLRAKGSGLLQLYGQNKNQQKIHYDIIKQ